MSTATILTIGDAARLLGVTPRKIRKLFERRILPPAKRAGCYRVFVTDDLPILERALRRAGYLHAAEESHAT